MKTLLEQLRDHLPALGDKPALVYGERTLTYGELDALSGRIAARVVACGGGRESVLPILLPRGVEYVAAELGVLRAGAAFSPLSTEYPEERVAYIRQDCACPFMIDEAFIEEAARCEPLDQPAGASWQDAAMVLYTSGSTGNPKGIVHDRYSFTRAIIRQLPIGCPPGGVELSVTPFSFAISVADIFVPLWVGATIHILSEEDRRDIRAIDAYIDAHGITASVFSPQLLKRLPDRPGTLANICCGGERLSGVWRENGVIHNGYGLSETLSVALAYTVDHAWDNTPIGRPLEDFTVHLLDDAGRPVAEGEEGEICIAGPLARGYINLPEQTARAFVENPLATGDDDRRMLRTGDMGKRLPDGNVLYVNRRDWMVKVNGQRVEMGEIEIQLGKIPGVETAAVKSFEDDAGQTYLCGYYTASAPLAEGAVRQALAAKLPGYMIPRFLVALEAFPLNPNGKLDRKALQPPAADRFQKPYAAPETPLQEQVCRGFEAVLGLARVGLDDDFFELGGDSIKVVVLQDALGGLGLSASGILEGRTPRGIAARAGEDAAGADRFAGMDFERDAYPLTDSQMGIYLDCVKEPGSLMYNNPARLRFPAEASGPEALAAALGAAALRAVIDGFPFMKIHLETRGGLPVIVPNPGLAYDIPVIDAGEMTDEAIEADFIKPFDLERGPLFRFALYRRREEMILMGDMHHIIADGTSTALFYDRVAAACEGKSLPAQQVDSFALCNYEEHIQETPEYAESKAFFDGMLAGAEVDSNLTPDELLPGEAAPGESRALRLSLRDELDCTALEAAAKALGLTENTLFLSAFAYALAKATGQEEALFCTVENGRHLPQLRGTMGMLVRTLPIYARIDEELAARDYMVAVQDTLFACIKHDACSFVQLAADYGVNADILFVYQGSTLNGITLNGRQIPLELLKGEDSMAKFSLEVMKRPGDYELVFDYRADLYRQETVENFARLMTNILKGLLAGGPLRDIALADERDMARWRHFNDNALEYDRSLTMVDLLRRQFAETPDRPAIVFKDKRLTYRELDELSERLAQALAGLGVGPETPVGIMVGRSELYPVCTIGVLKAGGACQPLDINYPEERLHYMLEDSGAGVVVADEDLAHLLGGYGGEVVYTKDIAGMPLDAGVQLTPPKAENLFSLLYTSGSTGKPKGVMLTHAGLVNFCLGYQKYFGLTCEDRASAYASFGFDASMEDFYPNLTKGSCVVIVPEETRLDLVALNELFIENKVTITEMTTQLGRQYAVQYPDNPHLRAMTVGGEKLVPCEPPQYRLVNTYGPTEASIYVSNFAIDRLYASVPIGSSFSNCDIYIVDKYLRPLPVGVPGELCIAGYPVGRGYLNRPDLTAEKYVENPFNEEPGYEKMYLTGDVCRYLPDGNIQFVGRRDEQVKIRGFRIELTEIERRIRAFEGISDACVVAKDLPAGGKAVVAYVVAGSPVDTGALDAFIALELPGYMVPSITMQIDAIPLNQNGKVDKRRLPEAKAPAAKAEGAARPLNDLERELVAIIAELTGQEDVAPEADLLSVGLTSLSMIMLSTLLYDRFGCRLAVADLMEGGTVLSIENAILKEWMAGRPAAEQPLPRAETADAAPLSPAQLGVYYGSMKQPEALVYNIPMLLACGPDTDAPRLARAAEQVIAAHPILSAHLEAEGGQVRQLLAPEAAPRVALHEMTPDEFEDFKAGFAAPFDLFAGPLCRAAVVKTESGTSLLFDAHHILFDGLSLAAFLRAVAEAYDTGEARAEEHSFLEAIAEEARWAEGAKDEAEAYYEELLRDFENASTIPADLAGKAAEGQLGECVAKTDAAAVEAFCRENSLTPAQLFLAAAFYTVARYTAERRVYFSMITNGREDARFLDSFGMFVKTVPLTAEIAPGETALDFVRASGKAMRQAIRYGAYPFLGLLDRHGYSPHINYACQLGIDEPVSIGGAVVGEEILTLPRPKFDVSIHIETREGTPAVCVQYNDALYSRGMMAGLADAMAVCVAHIIEAPGAPLTALSLLTPEAQRQVAAFGRGQEADIEERLFHRCFERQAARNPEGTALVAADETLTYGALDGAMNRIANGLVAAGVRPGDRVLILLPRTSRLMMAMYGALKAGAVYIPCDPDYPPERLRHIMEDSAAKYLLTTAARAGDFPAGQALDVEALLKHPEDTPPRAEVGPDDLAYIIYTSGSTGKPKGVMLTHGGISNYVACHPANRHVWALAREAHTLVSVTTVSFDMSLKETAVALCNGLTLVLASEEEANNPPLLAKLFGRTGGDAFNATPSRMAQYIQLPAFREALAGCRVVMCGGEKYPPKLLAQLKSITKARIFNTYGPTEITVSSNGKELTEETEVSIGPPLLNVFEYIVDGDGGELPPGVVGELYIGGAGVARGYFGQQALTEEKFIRYKDGRVYKTGDYAKWTPAGDVVILGRTDNQVKLRGLRIELGEIEKTLLADGRVKEAEVGIREIGGAEHLCAWFTADEPIAPEELKAALAKTLTAYMVPTAYCQLEAMPMTANGKTDVKALPLPQLSRRAAGEAPRGRGEEILCRIFAETLELDSVGATDDFFELGGTSLAVTSVLVEANQQGISISYGDVFAHPTPRQLAALVEEGAQEGVAAEVADFDYGRLEPLLGANTLEAFAKGPARETGNLLLTGVTGFLGIHLLRAYLETEAGTAYCLLRGRDGLGAEARLKAQLFYYFENSYEELFGGRIRVVEGDVTGTDWFAALEGEPVDTVINCAALVKHFASGTEIEDVNVGGVAHLIEYCKGAGACLIQVSTGSVAGDRVNGVPAPDEKLTETRFYFGQDVENKYIYSKFMAERLVLGAMAEGLSAKIMRVGNLAAREADGEFQINFTTNGFAGRLRAYRIIGAFPYSAMNTLVEMAPIDSTADAILRLAKTPADCSIFHPYNNHFVPLGDIILQMRRMGMDIELAEDEAYRDALQKAQADPEKARALTTLLAYENMDASKQVEPVAVENEYTTQVLYRLGFEWPMTSRHYMGRFLQALDGLGFFMAE